MDMDTLGYFLYMDEMERKQKEEQENAMRDIFGDNDDDNGDDES